MTRYDGSEETSRQGGMIEDAPLMRAGVTNGNPKTPMEIAFHSLEEELEQLYSAHKELERRLGPILRRDDVAKTSSQLDQADSPMSELQSVVWRLTGSANSITISIRNLTDQIDL